MDAIFYNNPIAKFLSNITGRDTFAIGPFILTTMQMGLMGTRTYNRIYTYTRQWTEMTVISSFLSIILTMFSLIRFEYIIICPFIYYLWYMIEYFIKYTHNFFTNPSPIFDYDTSKEMAYNIEAEIAAYNPHYYEEERFFSWVKFIFRRY